MDVKKIAEYKAAQNANLILIKALQITDEELEELKNSFCWFGWETFRYAHSYRVKLRVLFNERPEETHILIIQKFNLHPDTDTYEFLKKRCFKIYNGINPDINPNQLTLL